MTVSTNPADAVVYVTSLKTAATATSPATYEQGSVVLVAPDEVLTAAHVVEDASGTAYSGTLVSPGHESGVTHGMSGAANVHVTALADRTTLAGGQTEFTLIHLPTPVTDVPVMSIGQGLAGDTFTVSGYPATTSGMGDDPTESLSAVAGYDMLQGTALGAPGDVHGASGDPVWQMVGGVATVVGLTQSEVGTTGYFVGLTAADVAEIDGWIAQDHVSVATQPSAVAVSVTPSTPLAATPATDGDAVTALSTYASTVPSVAAHGYLDHAVSRMVTLLRADEDVRGAALGVDVLASDVLSHVGDNGGSRNLVASLLEGLVWGHDGGGDGTVVAAVAVTDPGLTAHHGSVQAAKVGFALGKDLLALGV